MQDVLKYLKYQSSYVFLDAFSYFYLFDQKKFGFFSDTAVIN